MMTEEYDKFYKKNQKQYIQSLMRILEDNIVPKHEKRAYMERIDNCIEELEKIVGKTTQK